MYKSKLIEAAVIEIGDDLKEIQKITKIFSVVTSFLVSIFADSELNFFVIAGLI